MYTRVGLSILTELVIGSSFGFLIGAVIEDLHLGIMLGALSGLIVGWLITAAAVEKEKSERRK